MYDWLVLSTPPTGGVQTTTQNPPPQGGPASQRVARRCSLTPTLQGALCQNKNERKNTKGGAGVSGLVHLLHVAERRRRALGARVGEKVRGHLRGQGGRPFRVQVRPEERLAGGLQEIQENQRRESLDRGGVRGVTESERACDTFVQEIVL